MVYSPLQAAAKYFKYYVHAANSKGHGTHSPFAFEFITKVMNDFVKYPDYEKIETLRKSLLADERTVQVQDFGAGSAKDNGAERTIASIAKNAAKPKKYSQLLYRMVKFYEAKNVLELGTSLGLTTSYLALGNPQAQVITMEGASAIASLAKDNFQHLGIKNINLVEGNFDQTLSGVLASMPSIDLAFIDGNHREEPTLRYFEQLLPHVHDGTLLVFDDIHWSRGMEAAWKKIVSHDAVVCDIDLFHIGIVSFNKAFKEKQTFTVRF
ncbi:MAG: class I SAM-dependent methyltransferase [Niabella sp.]